MSPSLDDLATKFLLDRGIDIDPEPPSQIITWIRWKPKRPDTVVRVPISAFFDMPQSEIGGSNKRDTRGRFVSICNERCTAARAIAEAIATPIASEWVGDGPRRVAVSHTASEVEEYSALKEAICSAIERDADVTEFREIMVAFGHEDFIRGRDRLRRVRQPRPCEGCGVMFVPGRNHRLGIRFCTLSCGAKAAWANPDIAERRVAGMRAAATPERIAAKRERNRARSQTPEFRAWASETNRRAWADPEAHAKRSANLKKANSTPERKALMSQLARARWADPEWAAATRAKMRGVKKSKAAGGAVRARTKKLWADPEWVRTTGAQISERLKGLSAAKRGLKRDLTPEHRKALSDNAIRQRDQRRLLKAQKLSEKH